MNLKKTKLKKLMFPKPIHSDFEDETLQDKERNHFSYTWTLNENIADLTNYIKEGISIDGVRDIVTRLRSLKIKDKDIKPEMIEGVLLRDTGAIAHYIITNCEIMAHNIKIAKKEDRPKLCIQYREFATLYNIMVGCSVIDINYSGVFTLG